MGFQTVRPYLSRFALGFAIGLPVAVTFVENVGSLKGVHGISMQPTLNPKPHFKGDVVLVNSWAIRRFEGINKGDIVTVIDPSDPDAVLIKRVIGVEGDHVKTINYKKKVVHIPAGHCWVEGDNHSHSHDSNSFGPVSLGLVQVKATHIVWPPGRWQKLGTFSPEGWLDSDKISTYYESRNAKDLPNNVDTTVKRDGITCSGSTAGSSRTHNKFEEKSSVTEIICGPVR